MGEMRAGNLRTERLGTSPMSRGAPAGSGQEVPSGRANVARVIAGWMIVATGGLVLANTAISSAGPAVTGSDWSFALLAAVIAYLVARGLWSGARWAWWVGLVYAAVGLFFALPVAVALVFGASAEPVGTGWDLLLFPATTVLLLALLGALWMARPRRSA
jgi:hypothetical protein